MNSRQQQDIAVNALLGDPAAQRAALEAAVKMADAGIEPTEIFKKAALHSLRAALDNDKLPAARDSKKKGADGKEFNIAVRWWRHKLTGEKKPTTLTAHELGVKPSAINRARRRHGDLSGRADLAKERALAELAWNESGFNLEWVKPWEDYRRELAGYWRRHRDELPPESVELLEKYSRPF